jgi:ribonuclease R
MKLTKKNLLSWMAAQGRPLRRREIEDAFAPPRAQAKSTHKTLVRSLLAQLTEEGLVVRLGRTYVSSDHIPSITAPLDIRRSGFGVVRHGDHTVSLAPEDLSDAWPGDLVEVALFAQGREPRGRVLRVVERRHTTVPLTLERFLEKDVALARPTDPRMPFTARVQLRSIQARPGDLVLGEAPKPIHPRLWEFTTSQILGREASLATQEALVKLSHAIPVSFPESALAEAAVLSEDPEIPPGRMDLRVLPLVTIDDERARDFDDAIYVEREGDEFRLVVAIADVAHYVRPGSALDREAQERGNSYYFPLSVEPMLPERLSNGLCSLCPGVPRLAVAVEILLDRHGRATAMRPMEAVMVSAARLTYSGVQRFLDGDPSGVPLALQPMIRQAAELAQVLWETRLARGTLDLDIPEAVIQEDASGVVHVGTRPRLFAHRIVEECMLAANEAVAELLQRHERPFPYRIHPAPDPTKLEALFSHLAASGIIPEVPATQDLRALQRLLGAVSGSPHEDLVHRLVLRSLMQAAYAPTNQGHFGLAAAAYTHFTSPIRRYADLLTHRALKALIHGADSPLSGEELGPLCEAINGCERRAVEAEREMVRRAAVLALQGREGEVMEGIVSGVAEFGFWVELATMPVDGMVRLASLDEYWNFDAQRQELLGSRSGQRIGLGDRVQVVLLEASIARAELNLTLATAPKWRQAPSPRGRRTPQRRQGIRR